MNLRKLFFLFWSTTAVGALVTVAVGTIMQWTDPSFGFMGFKAASFNTLMMAIVGAMFGVFSQLGFFAYLTITYIALGLLKKSYLWNALQAYSTLFALGGLGYMLYIGRDHLHPMLFWILPVSLLAGSWAVAYMKVKKTNNHAFIPTLFLQVVVTFLEAWPSLRSEESNTTAIIFMMIPLFICNAYQIMWLHRLVSKKEETGSAANAKPVV